MTYYKVTVEGRLIGYADVSGLRHYQKKHNALLFSNESRAQFVQIDETLYRDGWLCPLSDPVDYVEADIIAMGQDEYDLELMTADTTT